MNGIKTQMADTLGKVKGIMSSVLPNSSPTVKPRVLKPSEIVSRFYKMSDVDLQGLRSAYGEEKYTAYVNAVKSLQEQGY